MKALRFCVLTMLLLVPTAVSAETLLLRNGAVLENVTVVSESNEVVIVEFYSPIQTILARSKVEKIVPDGTPLEEPVVPAAAQDAPPVEAAPPPVSPEVPEEPVAPVEPVPAEETAEPVETPPVMEEVAEIPPAAAEDAPPEEAAPPPVSPEMLEEPDAPGFALAFHDPLSSGSHELTAAPETEYNVEVKLDFEVPRPTMLTADLLPDSTQFAQIYPGLSNDELVAKFNSTVHFDTLTAEGYEHLDGRGSIGFVLTSRAPADPGSYAKQIKVGYHDPDTGTSVLAKQATFTLVVK